MYMAPITRARTDGRPASASLALRRALGVPVLAVAAVVALPWIAVQSLVAGAVLAGRGVMQAVDYAGIVALGR